MSKGEVLRRSFALWAFWRQYRLDKEGHWLQYLRRRQAVGRAAHDAIHLGVGGVGGGVVLRAVARPARAVRAGVSSRWSVEHNALLSEPMRLNVTLVDDEWAAAVGQVYY